MVHVGVTLRVESREFGERKQVLGLRVNPGASDEPGLAQPLLREGVAEHEVLQTQERSVLQQAVVELGVDAVARNVGDVARFLPAVEQATRRNSGRC